MKTFAAITFAATASALQINASLDATIAKFMVENDQDFVNMNDLLDAIDTITKVTFPAWKEADLVEANIIADQIDIIKNLVQDYGVASTDGYANFV